MSRVPFVVSVPSVGDFTFRSRTIADQVRIEAEALRITGGPTGDEALRSIALNLATLSVLTVSAPDGWDVEGIDPLDGDDAVAPLRAVCKELRAAEATFRGRRHPERQAAGAAAVADRGVPLPPPVRPEPS